MLNRLLRPTRAKRAIFFIISDILISVLTIYLSFLLRFNFTIPDEYFQSIYLMIIVLIPLKVGYFYLKNLYFVAWRFFGLYEYKKLIFAHFVVYLLFFIIFIIFYRYFSPFPRSVVLIDLFLSLFFIGFLRIIRRLYLESSRENFSKKAIIYGVNSRTLNIIKSALNKEIDYFPVAIVTQDKKSIGTYISNVRVYDKSDLEKIIKINEINSVIIVEDLAQSSLDKLVEKLHLNNINDIKIAQIFRDEDKPYLKDLSVEDLLARKPKDLDKEKIASFIQDKSIMITGAGGSIGSEIVRQCVRFGAKRLILLDHSEYNLYKIEQEIAGKIEFTAVMQSVTNRELLENTFKTHKPDILIHAAAYKHVPLVEENIQEAIINNIIGTKNCIDLSIKYGVEKFVLISTDKAVRPTNVMGTTKRICELYAQNSNGNGTDIVAVRFGNVLGSSGSVIPKFKKQIEQGGPITVTHPDITRYFMLIPEACELVLQAGSLGRGGEIFILDMGEPIKIVDLAKKMCELSGKNDIEIEFTGLRAGEKLYEELLIDEADAKTEYDSIMIAKPTAYDIEKLNREIEELLSCEDKLSKLKEIVPEFNHNKI